MTPLWKLIHQHQNETRYNKFYDDEAPDETIASFKAASDKALKDESPRKEQETTEKSRQLPRKRPLTPFGDTQPSICFQSDNTMYRTIQSLIIPIRDDQKPNESPAMKSSVTICSPPSFYEQPSAVNSKRRSLQDVIPDNLPDTYFPETAMAKAVKKARSSKWEDILQGFKMGVVMIRFHPQILRRQVQDLTDFIWVALPHLTHPKNLVVRATLIFFKELIPLQLKCVERSGPKIMEKLLDNCSTQDLLLLDDVQTTLKSCIKVMPDTKAFWLIQRGFKHRNVSVRKTVVVLLECFVEKVGPDKFVQFFAQQALPFMAKFLQEGSLEIRNGIHDVFRRLVHNSMMRYHIKNCIPLDLLRLVAKPVNSIVEETFKQRKLANLPWEPNISAANRERRQYDWSRFEKAASSASPR